MIKFYAVDGGQTAPTYNPAMNPERTTVPLTVITGIDAAAKARVALALLARGGDGWALLDNDGGVAAAASTGIPAMQSSGCACCTGQVMLHAALVQLLRQHRPQQLLLVAAAAAEPAALHRALAQGVVMRAWQIQRTLCVWDDTVAASVSLEARALWQDQRTAADAVILCGQATTAAAIEAQLEAATTPPATASPSQPSSRRIAS